MKILLAGRIAEVAELTGFVAPISSAADIHALVFGKHGEDEIRSLSVSKVIVAENADPSYADDIVETLKTVLAKDVYDYIALIATKINKEAGSRVAQAIGAPAITEAIGVGLDGGSPVFIRSIMAGKAISKETLSSPAVIMVSPGRNKPADTGKRVGEIQRISISSKRSVEVIERKGKERKGVRVEDAEIIVSVGRGFKSKEDLSMAFKLAELIGAQVGCSRPIAADLKWLSEEHWIGLSGKKVKPKLYMAIGISGQPQHLAGIMDSKIIVAINKDPGAPIFKYSDYGIVEDLYVFIPKLMEKLSTRQK
ncbi:MAG TPA: electron transfer flavoprotein subunit alpha/FixB family protein [Sulfolobales archaeon]|nr:electron transfer flavoprotein subunit alpha/FixB family protein [Sulfolobales archaeon]